MPRSNAVLDDFNRASIGTNWSAQPLNDTAAQIVIQGSTAIGGSAYGYSWWNPTSFNDGTNSGVEVCIAVTTMPANSGGFWVALLQQPSDTTSTADGYELGVTVNAGNDSILLTEYANGVSSATLHSSSPDNWAVGDLLIMRRYGTGEIKCIRDRGGTETELASVTDTTYTGAFFAALGTFDGAGTVRVDDFSAGNFTAAASTGYIAAGAAATATSGNVTAANPAGIATDDALVLEITALDNVDCSVAPSGGSGNSWTRKTAQNNGTGLRQEIWWKRRGAGDTDTGATVTHAAGGKIIARMHAIRVPGTGDPFEAVGGPTNAAAAATGTFPNVTSLTSDALLFYAFSYAEDFTTGPSISNAQGLTLTERDETEVT